MNCGKTVVSVALLLLPSTVVLSAEADEAKDDPACPLVYINTTFENASPLFWEVGDSGEVNSADLLWLADQ